MIDYRLETAPFSEQLVTELHALSEQVFGAFERAELSWRLARMPDVSVQLARAGEIVGFKIGYAVGATRYHSWLGGVRADQRRLGIARRLMDAQHAWAKAHGYSSIETATTQDNAAMLTLNLQAQFSVIGTYWRKDMPRVLLLKDL